MLSPRFHFYRFLNAAESFYGEGCVKAITSIRSSRALVLTTKSVYSQGVFKDLLGFIRADDCKVIVSPFNGEPGKDEVFKALEAVEGFQPDTIIAVGGGSVIDGSKLIWYFYEKGDVPKEVYARAQAPGTLNRINFYAVPTTCGTGSEVSSAAVLSVDGAKVPVVTHDFLPKAIFLDPALLTELPAQLRIETAVDAATHAIEGYVSRIDNPIMDIFSLNALALIKENIFKSLEDPGDTWALLNLQMAAMFAGLVQNHCLVGLCHSISHSLARFGAPHGFLNLTLIRRVVEFNSRDASTSARYKKLFTSSGFSGTEGFVEFIDELRGDTDKRLSDFAELEEMLGKTVIDEIAADNLTSMNPVKPERDDIRNIMERAYEV